MRSEDSLGEEIRRSSRFQLLSRLGEGGMGVVYEAVDRERRVHVALKTLRNLGPQALLRFKREFRALQGLDHPNLVRLGELVEDGGDWYFTMELIEGVGFLDWVRVRGREVGPNDPTLDGVRPPAHRHDRPADPGATRCHLGRLRDGLAQLASALAALHGAGLVHRDIKPSNVLVTSAGRVVLLDFGLIVRQEDGSWSDDVVGTPTYMAPEQAARKRVGPAADWYSVGVMLYEALTGRPPYEGSWVEVLANKQRTAPAVACDVAAGVPPDLSRLCEELLHVEPGSRPGASGVLARLADGGAAPQEAPAVASSIHPPPFVGRAAELVALMQAFDDSQAGSAVTVMIEGESGVGKSALARRFCESVAQAVVLDGRCYERESVPYKALDGVIDSLSRYLASAPESVALSVLPYHAALLAEVFPVLKRVEAFAAAPRLHREVMDPHELRARVFSALRELLGRLGGRVPLVVVIDDLQWADADSFILLRATLAPPEAPRLLLLCTLRAGAPPLALAGDVRQLAVAALPPEEASQLAGQLLRSGAASGNLDAAALAREAGGHPLFIDELVRHALLVGGGAHPSLRLDEALQWRVERLEPRTRTLLELCAVAGSPLRQQVAARAIEMPIGELERHVSSLRVAKLVRTTGEGGRDAFEAYHDRVREAVLGHLPGATQAAHHRRLALALEGTEHADPELLVQHWRGAGDDERAARYACAGAERAAGALAFDRAAHLYQLALDLGSTDPTLLAKLAHALAGAGRGAEAAAAFLRAAKDASDGDALELGRRAADQLLRCGRVDDGLALSRGVLGAIGLSMPRSRSGVIAALLWRRAQLRLRGLRFRERPATQVTPETLARIDTCGSVAAGLAIVDPVRGFHFQTRQLLLALDAGEPHRVLIGLGLEAANLAALGVRSQKRVSRVLARAEALLPATGAPHAQGWVLGCSGFAWFLLGRRREAHALFERAEALFRDRCTNVHWELSTTQIFTVWSLFYLGELAELSRRVPRLLAEAQARGDGYAATNFGIDLCNVAWLVRDDVAGARLQAAEAMRGWSRGGFHMQHYNDVLARAHIALYARQGPEAWRLVSSIWEASRRAFLFQIEHGRIEALHLRARAALAAAQATRDRTAFLRVAEADTRRLERERVAYAAPLAGLLRAGLQVLAGDRASALERLGVAEEGLRAEDMALHAACALRRRGELTGGDAGAALVARADAWMAGQRVVNPAAMTAMLTPGFDES